MSRIKIGDWVTFRSFKISGRTRFKVVAFDKSAANTPMCVIWNPRRPELSYSEIKTGDHSFSNRYLRLDK